MNTGLQTFMQHRCSFDICSFRLLKLYNYLLIHDYLISCSTLEINVILPRNHVKFTKNHTENTAVFSSSYHDNRAVYTEQNNRGGKNRRAREHRS